MTTPANDNLIFVDPASGLEIRPWPVSRADEIARVLASAVGDGNEATAKQRIEAVRNEGPNRVFGATIKGEVVGAYTLKRNGMANEIDLLAVAKSHRRRGIGRILLQDALRRSGRRPLVAETDDEGLDFYKACGFKLVGRRKQPETGRFRYRVGWHAPGLRFKGGSTGAMTYQSPTDPEQSH